MTEYTKQNHIEDSIHMHLSHGGKNAKEVYFRGEVFPSAVAVGRCLKLTNPGTMAQYIKKGHTPDFEIVFRYKKATFNEDLENTKNKVLIKLRDQLNDLKFKIEKIEKQ